MFRILDGRSGFFQWDLNRKLIVEDPSIKEVHFCNRTSDCSLVCETYVNDVGLLLVDVPNILLQDDFRIKVYAYDGEATLHEACYEVSKRSKPDDYVYTETEVKRWEDLAYKIETTADIVVKELADFAETLTEVEAEVSGIGEALDAIIVKQEYYIKGGAK